MTADSRPTGDVKDLPAPARDAVEAYRARFDRNGDDAPLTVAWASGRINLIGEHTDYNEGYVLPVAIDRVVAIAGRANGSSRSRCYSVHHNAASEFAASAGAPSARGRGQLWVKYVRGVLAQLATAAPTSARPVIPAFDAAIAGDVPVGGGMSSSAALEVAVATFAAGLGGPRFPPMETALLCQRAEQESAGVRVGIMDQAASCLGRPEHAILLDCRSLQYEYVPINLPGIAVAVFDTGISHTLAGSEYNTRRGQCEAAVDRLSDGIQHDDPTRVVRSLRDVTQDDLRRYGSGLPEVLSRRARHVVSENERVLSAVEALRTGDARSLGELLYASHASLRDGYEVSCPELDAVVEIARGVRGTLGARMMGAGFGGSALVLVRRDALPALQAVLRTEYPKRTGRRGALHVCGVSGGPECVTVAPGDK